MRHGNPTVVPYSSDQRKNTTLWHAYLNNLDAHTDPAPGRCLYRYTSLSPIYPSNIELNQIIDYQDNETDAGMKSEVPG
jgi:hypothetical protein